MSYFAKTKCPKCGEIKNYWLGGYAFAFEPETICKKCGYKYDNVKNCIEMEKDR